VVQSRLVVAKSVLPSLEVNFFQLPASVLTTDYDTGVLLLTLQGLVNRHPHTATPLFLNTVEVFTQYYGADAHWAHYLETTKNLTFHNLTASGVSGVLDAALASGVIDGAVLYNGGCAPEPDATRYIALNLCGDAAAGTRRRHRTVWFHL
jgi:hypothetical protein